MVLDTQRRWRQQNRRLILDRLRALKAEVLAHYGKNGLCCAWPNCAVVDLDVLTLDHINNDGSLERRAGRGKGGDLYRRLRKANYPQGYQTLCANHQLKKELLRHRGQTQETDDTTAFLNQVAENPRLLKHRIAWNKGKLGSRIISVETRQKLSQAHRGKPKSLAHRAAIAANLKGRKITWGKKISAARRTS